MSFLALVVFVFSVGFVYAQDPSYTWLSYASYSAGASNVITALNATWKVPSMPSNLQGSNAPGWWYGIQTANGNGALIQPILAFGNGEPVFSIFNGVYDWNDNSWFESDSTQVTPGQTVQASLTYDRKTRTYTMITACVETGWSVTSTKVVESGQEESVAYFVLEHQPDTCDSYPTDNTMQFTNIELAVNGKVVVPNFTAHQEYPACDSQAVVVSPSVITLNWNSSAPNPSHKLKSASGVKLPGPRFSRK